MAVERPATLLASHDAGTIVVRALGKPSDRAYHLMIGARWGELENRGQSNCLKPDD
jgi:hypothetical protein